MTIDPVAGRNPVEVSLTPLQWPDDASALVNRLAPLAHRVWLDSPPNSGELGRYSIISAAPAWHLRSRGNRCTTIVDGNLETANTDPWQLMAAQFATLAPVSSAAGIPFTGGLIGAAAYSANHQQHALEPASRADASDDLCVGLYTWAVILDNREQLATLLFHPATPPDLQACIRQLLEPNRPPPETAVPFRLMAPFRPDSNREEYIRQVAAIQDYLQSGDCYQVNLSQRFSARCTGSSLEAYCRLRTRFPNPFSAWLDLGDSALLSLSPERFLVVQEGQIETRPIKGTRPRSDDPQRDALLAEQLLSSAKDRAENLMIVDLMRNDLGRCSVTGSVQVRELFRIESYPAVHHLVSIVESQLKPDCSPLELFRQCLPGGSITGAPKRRAMQVIDQLETRARRFYCGSIFSFDCSNRLDSNIAIRTLEVRDGAIHCWGGGGIVADSDPAAEYRETLDKVGKMMAALDETAARDGSDG